MFALATIGYIVEGVEVLEESTRSMVACSLKTVLPLKTVMVSLPVLVTATWAMWASVLAISIEIGHAARAVPARATRGNILKSMAEA